jgi:hypothetical protein
LDVQADGLSGYSDSDEEEESDAACKGTVIR